MTTPEPYMFERNGSPLSHCSLLLEARFLTVSFTEKFGNSAEFWKAIFWFGWGLSALWLIVEAAKTPFRWKKGDTESLINKLKGSEPPRASWPKKNFNSYGEKTTTYMKAEFNL